MADHVLDSASSLVSKAGHVASVELFELLSQPAGGAVVPIRLCTGMYPVNWNGYTWQASGQLLSFEPIKETLAPEAQGAKLTISGVPPSLRALALDAQYAYPGRPAKIYKAFLDGLYQVVGTPDVAFAGFVDKMRIVDAAGATDGTCNVEIMCESKYARLRIPNERRMSDEQQRALYPTQGGGGPDTALRFLTKMKEDTTAVFGLR